MEDETVRRRRTTAHHDSSHVSSLACYPEDWRVVPKHGLLGTDRTILRHGYFPADTFLRDCRIDAKGPVVVP